MKPLLRIVLFPLAIIYGAVIWLRNKFFTWGILKQTAFDKPVIVVGNISTGGTGKTPHIEYLINLLKTTKDVATLSRGYGRKSKGFLWVESDGTPEQVGDEPLQIKRKFATLDVAVCENRIKGINQILEERPYVNALLLDDAFQHRYVKPGLSIALLDYYHMPFDDYLLPSGRLREPVSALNRADIIIVTKTPHFFSPLERNPIAEKLHASGTQKVFFSYYSYGKLVPLNENEETLKVNTNISKDSNHNVLLFTGIANSAYIKDYLAETLLRDITHIEFPDHHLYSEGDMEKVSKNFSTIAGKNKLIITTEKDSIRLRNPKLQALLAGLPIFYIPVVVNFHGNDKPIFDKLITDYVRSH